MLTTVEGERSADRLIAFTDAVVAIAITLLALPLIEVGREAVGSPPGALLAAHRGELLAFAVGFFVIARLWWAHHRVFEHVRRWSPAMVVLDVLWLFSIVVLAIVTSFIPAYAPVEHPEVVALYIGTMVVSSAFLAGLALLLLRRPALTDGSDTEALARMVGSVETIAGFLIALAIGALLPVVGYLGLFVLVLTGRLDAPIVRRLQARRRTP